MNLDFLNVLFGAGGVAFVGLLVKATKEWREGSWKRRDETIEGWRKRVLEYETERQYESRQRQWWQEYAGKAVFVIRTHLGEEKVPTMREYPERPTPEEVLVHE